MNNFAFPPDAEKYFSLQTHIISFNRNGDHFDWDNHYTRVIFLLRNHCKLCIHEDSKITVMRITSAPMELH